MNIITIPEQAIQLNGELAIQPRVITYWYLTILHMCKIWMFTKCSRSQSPCKRRTRAGMFSGIIPPRSSWSPWVIVLAVFMFCSMSSEWHIPAPGEWRNSGGRRIQIHMKRGGRDGLDRSCHHIMWYYLIWYYLIYVISYDTISYDTVKVSVNLRWYSLIWYCLGGRKKNCGGAAEV